MRDFFFSVLDFFGVQLRTFAYEKGGNDFFTEVFVISEITLIVFLAVTTSLVLTALYFLMMGAPLLLSRKKILYQAPNGHLIQKRFVLKKDDLKKLQQNQTLWILEEGGKEEIFLQEPKRFGSDGSPDEGVRITQVKFKMVL